MGKTLVAYFSASGVTAGVAKTLADATGASLYEIKPEVPYTDADLNWNNRQSRSTVEMENPSFRPPLADTSANIEAYDTIFIGFPIWWYIAPTIINTFLESYDFSGKVIIPFATSGGSGMGKTAESLYGSCASSAMWRQGRVLGSRISKEDTLKWVETLGID